MRIPKEQLEFLKKEIKATIPDAVIYLFGSRVDDTKKGGDIDIMILTNKKVTWREKSKIKWNFYKKFGEQKIDIVVFSPNQLDPFKELIMKEGIKL